MTDPNNQNTQENPIGHFMVAAGAVMELRTTGKILITQRNRTLDWQPGEWELSYGRIAQFESVEMGLRREIKEELGLDLFDIVKVLSVWHIFRGSEKPENELIGITYHCRTENEAVILSDEHEAYRWVTPEEALAIITVAGIRRDIEAFIRER